MFRHLDIAYPRERLIVGLADAALSAVAVPFRRRRPSGPPRRILLLRLERIGDLLMSLGAIAQVRTLAPDAAIDLVVGSWNASLAALVPGITTVEPLDAPWLSREPGAANATGPVRRAFAWRPRQYDLAINFEGDIRSHLLMAASGARRRVGFDHAGGGPVLTDRVPHDASRHTAENAVALVERAFDLPAGSLPGPFSDAGAPHWRLNLPAAARDDAARLLAGIGPSRRPIVAFHAAGGRLVKQWEPSRFAEAARHAAERHGAAIVFTGSPGDRDLVEGVRAQLGGVNTVSLVGVHDLTALAAVLERCDLMVTGDTGPMHLAAAVGTPVVAVFGPSLPARYAPLTANRRIVRIDLPCSPCNRIRRPPDRCTGHIPQCLAELPSAMVQAAVDDLLRVRAAATGGGAARR